MIRGEVPSNRLKDKIDVIDTCLEELPPCGVGEMLSAELFRRHDCPIRLRPCEHFPCAIRMIGCHRLLRTSSNGLTQITSLTLSLSPKGFGQCLMP